MLGSDMPLRYRFRESIAAIESDADRVILADRNGRQVRIPRSMYEVIASLPPAFTDRDVEARDPSRISSAKAATIIDLLIQHDVIEPMADDSSAASGGLAVVAVPKASRRMFVFTYSVVGAVLCTALLAVLFTAHWNVREIAQNLHAWVVIPIFALCTALQVLMHEGSHYVVARLYGIRVRRITFFPYPSVVPDSGELLAKGQIARFSVAAAGPMMDALVLVALCSLIRAGSQVVDVAFASSVVLFFGNLNPLTDSDGAHMLESILEDPLARIASLGRSVTQGSSPRTIARYRSAFVLYLVLLVGLCAVSFAAR